MNKYLAEDKKGLTTKRMNKCQIIPKRQSEIDNPEKLATYGAQDKDKQNKNNPEKLAIYGTQDKDKKNKNNPEKLAIYGAQDKDKKNKYTYIVCVGHHYALTNTNNVTTARAHIQTTEGKDEPNIIFMWKS